MKIAYIGSPKISADVLQRLINDSQRLDIQIAVVLTQPDMPVGRKKIMTPTPVKTLALQNNLPVIESINLLNQFDIELSLLFAFGEIIPQKVLDLPTYGFWNIHPSLLPAFRGASPITFPIFLGNTDSGVTLMQMDADLDHGPIIAQKRFSISTTALREDIENIVVETSYELISASLPNVVQNGKIPMREQNHSEATYTRPLSKQDGYVDLSIVLKALKGDSITKEDLPQLIKEYCTKNVWDYPESLLTASTVVWNMHRALHGWPGLWTQAPVQGEMKRIKLLDMQYTSPTTIELIQVQIEGKNPTSLAEFNAAYSIFKQ